MKEDYPLKGPTVEVKVQLEKEVSETLKKMAEYKKLGESEMINTAVKRFIAVHSDYLPRKK
jgi:metal-responsive CopG/Arc/MetJ family transcriptional regulator